MLSTSLKEDRKTEHPKPLEQIYVLYVAYEKHD